MIQIATDSYSRWDLIRTVVPLRNRRGCAWCGNTARFRYGISRHDRPEPVWGTDQYCGIGCYRSHDL